MEDILPMLVPLLFVTALALERVFPARPLPAVRGWVLKNILFFAIGGAIAGALPAVIALLLGSHTVFDLSGLGTLVGGLVGFALADVVTYGVHRLLHNVPSLWRWTHQLHHSAERLDAAGGVYHHPLDHVALGGATLFGLALLGLSPAAAALAGVIGFAGAMFQHMNIRTPQWVGYIIQRPEAHAIHHARGVHAYNYGTFMLWDILFGTFRNPKEFRGSQGFWDGASSRVGAMLLGRDVAEPRSVAQEGSLR